MMKRLEYLIQKTEGLIYLLVILLLVTGAFFPPIQSILENQERSKLTYQRIETHLKKLKTPQKPSDLLEYRLLTFPSSGTNDKNSIINIVQTDILEKVRKSKTRLIDLREASSQPNRLEFILEIEGDIQAILEFIESVGNGDKPILIEDLRLRPLQSSERPDKKMRLSTSLYVWRQP